MAHTSLSVGNGGLIRFWEDIWLGDAPLSISFPQLYRLTLAHNVSISSMISSMSPSLSWDFKFFQDLNDRECCGLVSLLARLEGVSLRVHIPDRRTWLADSLGTFSFFGKMIDCSDIPIFVPFALIWKADVPLKVRFFAWSVVHKRINTNELFQRRRPYLLLSPQWCIMSKSDSENIDHLFVHCPVARWIWCKLFGIGGESWVMPDCVAKLFHIKFWGLGRSKKAVVIWKCAFLAVFWVLWIEKTLRIFDNRESSLVDLWDKVYFLGSFWAHSSKVLRDIPLFVLRSNWRAVCC